MNEKDYEKSIRNVWHSCLKKQIIFRVFDVQVGITYH